jgi:hypothetical protein
MLCIRLLPKLLMALMGLAPPDLSVALKPAFCLTPTMDLHTANSKTKVEGEKATEVQGPKTAQICWLP